MNIILIKYLLIAVQVLFIGRFHLELSKVNGFAEPVSSIRKLTNPFVLPIKRLIPWVWAKKFAAIKVAFIVTFIVILMVNHSGLMASLITTAIMLIFTWISFLQYGMFLFVIGSWIQIPALQGINTLLYQLFEPMLRPIRKILPSFWGLDFSPIVFLFGLSYVTNAFSHLVSRLLY